MDAACYQCHGSRKMEGRFRILLVIGKRIFLFVFVVHFQQ